MVPIYLTEFIPFYNLMPRSMSSNPFPFPLPISELQEMNRNESIIAPGQSSTSQTNIAATGEVDSSLFEQSTFQTEALLSSSENYDSEDDFTNSSSYQSSSSEKATVEKIKRKLSMYQSMLDNRLAKDNPEIRKKKNFGNFRDDVSHQMLLHQSISIIENSFQRAMYEANLQGYAYGIIFQDGSVISGSSPSLRKWWEETVRFEINGPAAVNRYYMENQLKFDRNKDADKPRRTYDILMELCDATLGSLLSALMNRCDPPQRKFPLEKKAPPPWWPTGSEPWWDQVRIEKDQGPPPYKKPHDLRKVWKAAVVIAIIKHMAPAFDKLARVVKQSKNIQGRMNVKEMKAWNSVLKEEAKMYSRDHPDMFLTDLLVSFPMQASVLSNSRNSSSLNDHVEGYQSQLQLLTLQPEQQVSFLIPSQPQHHHQMASMCNFATEQGMMRYTCDNPMCLHHDERSSFPTVELQNQHFWSCGFRNTGGQSRTPIELPAFPTSIMCQDTIPPQFPLCPQASGAPSQQMDPSPFGPITCQPPNAAYEEVSVAFSEMGAQQQDFSFDSFRIPNYSVIPNDGQHMGPSQSAIFGHGFFNGEGSCGNVESFI